MEKGKKQCYYCQKVISTREAIAAAMAINTDEQLPDITTDNLNLIHCTGTPEAFLSEEDIKAYQPNTCTEESCVICFDCIALAESLEAENVDE